MFKLFKTNVLWRTTTIAKRLGITMEELYKELSLVMSLPEYYDFTKERIRLDPEITKILNEMLKNKGRILNVPRIVPKGMVTFDDIRCEVDYVGGTTTNAKLLSKGDFPLPLPAGYEDLLFDWKDVCDWKQQRLQKLNRDLTEQSRVANLDRTIQKQCETIIHLERENIDLKSQITHLRGHNNNIELLKEIKRLMDEVERLKRGVSGRKRKSDPVTWDEIFAELPGLEAAKRELERNLLFFGIPSLEVDTLVNGHLNPNALPPMLFNYLVDMQRSVIEVVTLIRNKRVA